MNHDESLAQLRAVREAVTRITQDVDAAIAYLETFQPVVDAFQQRQGATQAQWEELMRAGGPDNLDVETQTRHATELRAAEVGLINALKDYIAGPPHAETSNPPEGQETHEGYEHSPEHHDGEYHPY